MFAGLPLIVTAFSRSNVRPSVLFSTRIFTLPRRRCPAEAASRSCQQSQYTLATSTSRAIGSRGRGGAQEQMPRPAARPSASTSRLERMADGRGYGVGGKGRGVRRGPM